ncbi:50S ribosomal protein L29 [Gluconacetobacter johannae DSM 13595]|uniref:Large ribosomal subunit protein uL29 n=1 Tax=Gluconacetobacter johannae TaxID=112140 RepID=A0A7W4P2N9_9PROT|nr:50S ribosomal protein L29 [Gluconacetobacter johannae]MBB2175361.1 50S ribosomal protein L29 [Gluconacetobacter johannae]GBQ88576.1 50S ribosomal protein L29 [Gluconacetobacter johannae DSM 13595]
MAKATKPADLRAKTAEELETLLIDLKREQFNLRFQRATGQNEGQARVRTVRREIARVKTIASEALKKNAAGANASAAKS